MQGLSIEEIRWIHERLIASSGGDGGLRDQGRLEASIAQPFASFEGNDLYPDLISKAAMLGFFLVMNHPFVDGNKRIGHAAMETFLVKNGMELSCSIDRQEEVILDLAAGNITQEAFISWVREHARSL